MNPATIAALGRAAGRMTATFVTDHAYLTPYELAYGYRAGYLDEAAVVETAGRMNDPTAPGDAVIDSLALLLSDEHDRVEALLAEIEARPAATQSDSTRVWLYLVLLLAHEHRRESADPTANIERIYADFDYPEEIEGFVPFLPAPKGESSGPDAIESRWTAYLEARRVEFTTERRR